MASEAFRATLAQQTKMPGFGTGSKQAQSQVRKIYDGAYHQLLNEPNKDEAGFVFILLVACPHFHHVFDMLTLAGWDFLSHVQDLLCTVCLSV